MNVTVEAQNVEMSPDWKQQLQEKLAPLSDPRDPVINARSTFCFNATQKPPALVTLVISMRGKHIVVRRESETVDGALKMVLDTAKREVRKYYELRSSHRRGHDEKAAVLEDLAAAIEPEE